MFDNIGYASFFLKVNPFSNNGFVRLLYAVGIIMQIFIYCWFGNEVEIKVRLLDSVVSFILKVRLF